VPVELVIALEKAAIIAPILFLISAFLRPGAFWPNGVTHGLYSVLAFLMRSQRERCCGSASLVAGPRLTFLKGLALGLLGALIWAALR
jgi:hypothetical protein